MLDIENIIGGLSIRERSWFVEDDDVKVLF